MVKAAFQAYGELNRDVVVVVRGQGPKANGMPELHGLTPSLSVLQDDGYRVALVTDGRMSGASGKVPAAIHVSPEAKDGGPLSLIQTGDVIRLDASTGQLTVLSSQATLNARQPAPVQRLNIPPSGAVHSFQHSGFRPAQQHRWWVTITFGSEVHPVLHEALSRSPVMPVLVIPEISMAAPWLRRWLQVV